MVGNSLATIMCSRLNLVFSNESFSVTILLDRPFKLSVLDIYLVIFLSFNFYLFLISGESEL